MANDQSVLTNILIIGLTVVASWQGFSRPQLIERYLLDVQRVRQYREYFRLMTSGLFHADLGHLFFNMFSLYAFGRGIEIVYGGHILALIYLSSILGGSLLSVWLHRREEYRALGASGGVCGVIYAAIFLLPGGSVYLFFIPIPIPASVYAVLFLVLSFWGFKTRFGRIGHDAHIGGAIVGLVVTTLLYPGIIAAQPALYALVMAISVGLTVYFARQGARLRY